MSRCEPYCLPRNVAEMCVYYYLLFIIYYLLFIIYYLLFIIYSTRRFPCPCQETFPVPFRKKCGCLPRNVAEMHVYFLFNIYYYYYLFIYLFILWEAFWVPVSPVPFRKECCGNAPLQLFISFFLMLRFKTQDLILKAQGSRLET